MPGPELEETALVIGLPSSVSGGVEPSSLISTAATPLFPFGSLFCLIRLICRRLVCIHTRAEGRNVFRIIGLQFGRCNSVERRGNQPFSLESISEHKEHDNKKLEGGGGPHAGAADAPPSIVAPVDKSREQLRGGQ